MATLQIKGSNAIDEQERVKALETVNKLSTAELKRLASLAESEKARSYLSNSIKFQVLKGFL